MRTITRTIPFTALAVATTSGVLPLLAKDARACSIAACEGALLSAPELEMPSDQIRFSVKASSSLAVVSDASPEPLPLVRLRSEMWNGVERDVLGPASPIAPGTRLSVTTKLGCATNDAKVNIQVTPAASIPTVVGHLAFGGITEHAELGFRLAFSRMSDAPWMLPLGKSTFQGTLTKSNGALAPFVLREIDLSGITLCKEEAADSCLGVQSFPEGKVTLRWSHHIYGVAEDAQPRDTTLELVTTCADGRPSSILFDGQLVWQAPGSPEADAGVDPPIVPPDAGTPNDPGTPTDTSPPSPDAGIPTAPDASSADDFIEMDEGGWSCRIAGSRDTEGPLWLALLGALGWVARRKRRQGTGPTLR
ncbi:MAG: hypothetical protein KA712_24275 [Myxococcales bacterium]|nr:hypothetical protein [Myxococcales bacterium]